MLVQCNAPKDWLAEQDPPTAGIKVDTTFSHSRTASNRYSDPHLLAKLPSALMQIKSFLQLSCVLQPLAQKLPLTRNSGQLLLRSLKKRAHL
ncbi:Uncharacterised protein [Chlamydia trachomatis]|nr:Uncharacterised protein [Chlamydia trachomatis]